MSEESQGVFHLILLDYLKLAGISSDEEEDTNLGMTEFLTSILFLEDNASAYIMQGNLEELMKRMDEYEKIIHKQ